MAEVAPTLKQLQAKIATAETEKQKLETVQKQYMPELAPTLSGQHITNIVYEPQLKEQAKRVEQAQIEAVQTANLFETLPQAAPEPYVVISGVSTYGRGGKYGAANATDYTGRGERIGTALGTWHLEGQNPVKSLLTRAATSPMYPKVYLTSSFYNQNKDTIEQWKADNPALASKVFLEGERVDYGERFNIESRAQAKAIQDELKANWGGTLTPSARAIVEAPVGSDISNLLGKSKAETQQLQAKAAYLQSPTAKWGSQEDYSKALESVTRFGIEVPKPAGTLLGSTLEQRAAEKSYFEQTEKTYLSPVEQLAPSELGYLPHFTPYVGTGQLTPEQLSKIEISSEQSKAQKWWSGLSETEKKEALITAGTIDIGIAGAFAGEKIFGTKESELGWKTDVYRALNIEGAKTQTKLERAQEAIVRVGTGTTAQAVAMMVGVGAGMKILTGSAKAVGIGETAVVAGEKALGLGFGGLIAAEVGGKAISGKPGTAIAELGLIGVTLPMASFGSRAVSKVGEFTPTSQKFMKFVETKAAPLGETRTAKFIEAKAEPMTSLVPKGAVSGGLGLPVLTAEAGLVGMGKIIDFPANLYQVKIREPIREKLKEIKTTIKERTTEPIIERLPEFIKSRIEEKSIISMMTPKAQEIYKALPTPEAKTMMRTAYEARELVSSLPESSIKEMYLPEVSMGKTGMGEIGLKVGEVLAKHPEDILVGSMSTAKFIKGFREVRTPTPEGKKLKEGIGDIELASEFPSRYTEIGFPEKEVHGITSGNFAFGRKGDIIRTKFGGESVTIAGARVESPITIEGQGSFLSPKQQLSQKIEGSVKYLSRKTEVIKDKTIREKEYAKVGESEGFSLRRGKDIPDVLEITEALAKKQLEIPSQAARGKKSLKLMEKYREAEATKSYATTPEAMALEYGYKFAKEYPELIKGKVPVPLIRKEKKKEITTEYYDASGERIKSPLDYYPLEKQAMTSLVGGYYPSEPVKAKPSGGYYRGGNKGGEPTGYYQPPTKKPDYYPPYKPKHDYYPPIKPTKEKYPVLFPPEKEQNPEEFMKVLQKPLDSRKEYKLKEKFGYLYKPRASPIFWGDPYADKPVNPLGEPLINQLKGTGRHKKSDMGKSMSKKVETFDLGFGEEKTNNIIYTKKHNKNINKKQFWET